MEARRPAPLCTQRILWCAFMEMEWDVGQTIKLCKLRAQSKTIKKTKSRIRVDNNARDQVKLNFLLCGLKFNNFEKILNYSATKKKDLY